jgi:hypothetical protein
MKLPRRHLKERSLIPGAAKSAECIIEKLVRKLQMRAIKSKKIISVRHYLPPRSRSAPGMRVSFSSHIIYKKQKSSSICLVVDEMELLDKQRE